VAGVASLSVLGLWSLDNLVYSLLVSTAIAMLVGCTIFVPKKVLYELVISVAREGEFKKWFLLPDKIAFVGNERPNIFFSQMLLSNVLIALIAQVDVWFIGSYLTKHEVGIYSVATRFSMPLMVLLSSIQIILWPRVAKMKSAYEIRSAIVKLTKMVLVLTVGCGIYSLTVPLLAPLIFGKEYGASVLPAQVLSLRLCLALMLGPIHMVGYNLGLIRIYWIVNLLQLSLVVGLNVWLLPRIGLLGSAFALLGNDLLGIVILGPIIWTAVGNLEESGKFEAPKYN